MPTRDDQIQEDLREIRQDVKELIYQVSETKVEIARLKVKATMWGTFAGFVVSAGMYLYQIFKH